MRLLFTDGRVGYAQLLCVLMCVLPSGGGLTRETSAMRMGAGEGKGSAGVIAVSQADVQAMQRRIANLEKDIAEIKSLLNRK